MNQRKTLPVLVKARWQRRKNARRQELLAAALELFEEKGYASTRLEDVVKRAGVSKGTFYLYFVNKEELFTMVVRENLAEAIEYTRDDIPEFSGHSADLLRCFISGWWQRVSAPRVSSIARLIVAEAGSFPELAAFYNEEVLERSVKLVSNIVARGIAQGHFTSIGPASAAQALLSPILMLMICKSSLYPYNDRAFDPESFIDSFIALILSGLVPRND
ncbi:TetR/AcrR family transcriptional regulator [Noviherbaspirillum saxi]|uniref:TetR/AcrR family transcriptional regulator n=1 Tax=Noviherbaspirillum saxi TaxID=2320863 RepID=A0A3A3FFZ5_9BURK|nr:TetR/AcrR family transcriptional regulator [Noviherbaspirillum saxi]RJF92296.1 TetR/AcrR family transcriptional regulator [Noviherbaspirillum saxi]